MLPGKIGICIPMATLGVGHEIQSLKIIQSASLNLQMRKWNIERSSGTQCYIGEKAKGLETNDLSHHYPETLEMAPFFCKPQLFVCKRRKIMPTFQGGRNQLFNKLTVFPGTMFQTLCLVLGIEQRTKETVHDHKKIQDKD